MRKIQSKAPSYILWCTLLASIILALFVHGPRLLAYMSTKSGFHAAKEESDYAVIPVTLGHAALHVLVADTLERRTKGLSYRESLGKNQAMLFVFDDADKHGIWMKDMKFSIDIIWLDNNLRVVDMKRNISPDTFPEVFEPKSNSSFVLETSAGFADKNGVTLGSELVLYR
jgi:uncharacterized protein